MATCCYGQIDFQDLTALGRTVLMRHLADGCVCATRERDRDRYADGLTDGRARTPPYSLMELIEGKRVHLSLSHSYLISTV